MPYTQSDLIEVKRVRGKGRGVFARRDIPKGTIIETVPVIVIANHELEHERGSKLADYVYTWGRDTVAVALGYGSMYNHSYRANARYDDEGQLTKVFTAVRNIAEGEEITINYNGEPRNRGEVHFEVRE